MDTAQTQDTTTRPWYKHPAVIGVGATAGAILVIGASVAIALELTDDLWSPEYSSPSSSPVAPVGPVEAAAPPAAADVANEPLDAASALVTSIDAAVAAAGGVGATSVATAGALFEVDVLLADGREIDVEVGPDGSTSIDSGPYAEPTADPALDVERIPSIVDAALAAVASSVDQGGSITELSTTSAPGRAFDVTVVMPNGGAVYLELADDLSVVEIDLD